MIRYDLHNPTKATRIVHDAKRREVRVAPGQTVRAVDLPSELVVLLRSVRGDLVVEDVEVDDPLEPVKIDGSVVVEGMWGIGDNIHERAVIRELMRKERVWLTTCHWHIFHDLVAGGLNLSFRSTNLRAQAKTIHRERDKFGPPPIDPPADSRRIKLWYRKDQIDRYGSILQAMAGTCGIDHEKPLDFSLPVPDAWAKGLPEIATGGKPLMVYRPIVLRREWNSANRNPDAEAYRAIFDAIRDRYFVVSIADLMPNEEWIVGQEAPADLKLHRGELDFQQMASLFKRADLAFCNAGFGPVLAQAVGTPGIVVYGGRESYRTTQRAGAHLAPTLGIDPIKPCDCHTERHDCGDKKIDVVAAIERAREFAVVRRRSPPVEVRTRSDTLIFATTYVDNPDRQHLTELWLTLTSRLNPDADLLIVDSASPVPVVSDDFRDGRVKYELHDFGNNVGHLSRGGKDGWGRAFCKGLELAVERGYERVAHVEGDSLLRVPVGPIFAEMAKMRRGVASTPVKGMERDVLTWVETGLMFFETSYLRRSNFVKNYNWPVREVRPTPEKVIYHMVIKDLLMLPLKAQRSDKRQITRDTVVGMDLDWITHCHDDAWAYDRFFEAAMAVAPETPPTRSSSRETAPLKLNLGCGDNRLPGWENHDIDVDITRPLPWADDSIDFLFIEHCVEHVSYKHAIGFFEEVLRVLRPGGVFRVVVPSIEQIMACDDQAYFEFARKWGGEATLRGAAKAILFSHGHEMAWTESLMGNLLAYAGFVEVAKRRVGTSTWPELRGVEGHGRVIGDRFNEIESLVFEAEKPGSVAVARAAQPIPRKPSLAEVAVVVGGGKDVVAELAAAKMLIEAAGARPTFLAINDMIPRLAGPCIAVSLHPPKLKAWLEERKKAGLPEPTEVWAHNRGSKAVPYYHVTHSTDDWRGSSGLFAVKIAREKGIDRIILCGVPMRADDQHFVRNQPWNACGQFKIAWNNRKVELAPHVRSMSGWTAEVFGRPDEAFLGVDKKRVAA